MIPVEGQPGVWRRGNRYVVKYTHRGKVRKKYLRTLTEVKKFKAAVAAGDASPTSARSFREYATEWLGTYKGRSAKGISDETRESYTHALTAHAIPFFGTTRLDRIDPPMLRHYIAHLEAKGLTAATIRRYYAPVRAALATAYEDKLIPNKPTVRVVVRTPQSATRNHLTADETTQLLAEIPDDHADLVLLLSTTGARISEALGAVYGGIGQDPAGRPQLRFPKSKTEAGLQPIPLTPDTARMLTRRRTRAAATDDDLIFPNAAGNPYDRRAWTRRVFKPAAKRAGVPWASPHKLRHGVATLMAEQGYEAHDIARMLRHADGGALAQRTYMHPRVRPVDFLDQALSQTRKARNA
jgi:integrase